MNNESRLRRSAFTLIELLVVIAIMGILAGLILAVVAQVKNTARKTKAKAEIASIITAWNQYIQDYTLWPDDNKIPLGNNLAGQSFSGSVISLLSGNDEGGQNPRKNPYMEFKSGEFLDPWKQPYQFIVDKDMDDKITLPANAKVGTVTRQVVAWSRGPDKRDDNEDTWADNICSWK